MTSRFLIFKLPKETQKDEDTNSGAMNFYNCDYAKGILFQEAFCGWEIT